MTCPWKWRIGKSINRKPVNASSNFWPLLIRKEEKRLNKRWRKTGKKRNNQQNKRERERERKKERGSFVLSSPSIIQTLDARTKFALRLTL